MPPIYQQAIHHRPGEIETKDGDFRIILPMRMEATLMYLDGSCLEKKRKWLVWNMETGLVLPGGVVIDWVGKPIDLISIVVPCG